MDVFSELRRDHHRIAGLFDDMVGLARSSDTAKREQLCETLRTALQEHAEVEDLHVYRVFQQAEETRDAAAEAVEAHRQITTLLDELTGMGKSQAHWIQTFTTLHDRVKQHFAAEEQILFLDAEEILTPQEMEEMGTAVERAKKELRGELPPPAGGIPA
jgi:hemerythrin superfamily protein